MKTTPFIALSMMIALTGCGAMTPTRETITGYSIYDIKGSATVTPAAIAEAVTQGLRENSSGIQVSRNIPPYPIPDTPGRFTLTNPFAKSNMGALLAAQGANMTMATCDGAFVVGNAQNSSMKDYGENATFTVCLWQYKDGYHLDFYTKFDRVSGGVSTKTLAATLMRPLTGDSSQFIPRTINNVVAEVQKLGLQTSVVESYP